MYELSMIADTPGRYTGRFEREGNFRSMINSNNLNAVIIYHKIYTLSFRFNLGTLAVLSRLVYYTWCDKVQTSTAAYVLFESIRLLLICSPTCSVCLTGMYG